MQKPLLNSSNPQSAEGLKIPIGKLIKKRIEYLGMCKAELARRLNMSPANIHKIFKRDSLDVTQLCRISLALNYDFVGLYRAEVVRHIRTDDSSYDFTHGMDDRSRYMQSLERRIDLITDVLNALNREDVGRPAAKVEAGGG